MAITTCSTFCFIKFINNLKLALLITSDYHLSNTLTIIDNKIFGRKINYRSSVW